MKFIGTLGWLSVLTMSTLACTPKAGDPCEKGKGACKDPKTALACHDGNYIEVPCKGQGGCKITRDQMGCDYSGNEQGDPCAIDNEGQGQCAPDGKSLVVCKTGKFNIQPCRGPNGCKFENDKSNCDTSLAHEGDPCEGTGYGCSVDGKALLKCEGGKAIVDEKCADGGNCKTQDGKVGCSGGTPAPPPAPPAPATSGSADPEDPPE